MDTALPKATHPHHIPDPLVNRTQFLTLLHQSPSHLSSSYHTIPRPHTTGYPYIQCLFTCKMHDRHLKGVENCREGILPCSSLRTLFVLVGTNYFSPLPQPHVVFKHPSRRVQDFLFQNIAPTTMAIGHSVR